MSWILEILGGLLPNFWPWILGALGIAGIAVTSFFKGKSRAKQKQAEAALDSTLKGIEAARKGRAEATEQLAKGKTPEEIRRGNDGRW